MIVFYLGYLFSLTLPLTGDLMPKVVLKLDKETVYKESVLPAEYRGKQIEIFKVYANFFEKRILVKRYYDTAPCFASGALKIEYNTNKNEIYLSMPSDQSDYMYTFHQNFDLHWRDTLKLNNAR